MTQTAVTCPANGCEYSGAKSSVLGHYSGMRDDAHAGGYRRAKEIVEENSGDGEFIEDEPDGGGGQGAEEGGSPGEEDPIMGDGSTSQQTDGSTHREDLPCGHESFNPSEAPEPPFDVECNTCGESWTVTEL